MIGGQNSLFLIDYLCMNIQKINIPLIIMKEGKRFVAYTPALDIATSATTEKKVKARFAELVTIFFEEIAQAGTIEQVLKNLGWLKVRNTFRAPTLVGHSMTAVSIPRA